MADAKWLTAIYVVVGPNGMKWGTLFWTERTFPMRVVEIKEYIIEKLGWHTSAMPKFYKASLSEQEMSNLDKGIAPSIDPTTILRYSQWVNKVWPDGFPAETVAFIVSVKLDVLSLHSSSDADPNFERTAKTEKVQSRVSGAPKGINSSTLAKLSKFDSHQKTPNTIHNGRPHDRVGPPIHLYHPVFDSFLAGLDPTNDVPAEKLSGTIRLLRLSQAQYNTETGNQGRTAAFVIEIDKLLDASLIVREADGVKADGSISAISGAVCLIMEIKNEIGQGGSDPSIQGAILYAKYWAHDKMADIRAVSCCPSFILAVAGPWACILGAIMLDHPIVQPLTPFLWVGSSCNPRTQSNDHALARVFTSLASSISSLVHFYDNLPGGKNAERFDPHIRHYITNNNRTDFTYLDPISDGKLVFLASTKSKRHIIVKYAESYHVKAHRLLANAGLAPELLFVSSEHGFHVGKLLMLVMEKVHGCNLVEMASIPLRVEENVSDALKLLHQEDIVFGDLRRPNVMATLDANGTITGGMLVDFDWCGTDGQATYPTDINTEIDWPMGVGPGTRMSKEHDWVMFNKIFPS